MSGELHPSDLIVPRLGDCAVPSPLKDALFVDDREGVICGSARSEIERRLNSTDGLAFFETAGPRKVIFFRPDEVRCALVTCGGLCPGLNDVIRGITMQLEKGYGVREILGVRYGYRGLVERLGHEPLKLTAESVSEIHRRGGTVLKSSRGQQNLVEMADFLERRRISVLFTIGGDGTQRGAAALCRVLRERGQKISVVGIPKTIDNDIPWVQKSFGFETAVAEAVRAINGGHVEAHDFPNGIAIIRLMGRDSGFIAAAATVASGDVNFCLVPEVPFVLDGPGGLHQRVEDRLRRRGHAVIVVAEGAGKELRQRHGYDDIGLLLRDLIRAEMPRRGLEPSVKYIDPSYIIRSVPATADDSVFCAQLAHNAVHAAMAGRTEMAVGYYGDSFVHIPSTLLEGPRKRLDAGGRLWRAVLETTGQPRSMP